MTLAVADWVPVASLIASCLGIPALATLIMTDIFNRHKQNSEAAKEKKKAERKEEIREAVKDVIFTLETDMASLKTDSSLTKQCLQATLRHDLYEIADKWLAKGYCPIQDKEDFENIYKKYHSLGNNGVMDDTYCKVMELPVAKPRSTRKRITDA